MKFLSKILPFFLILLISGNSFSADPEVSYKILRGDKNPRDEKLKEFDFNDVLKQAQTYRKESESWKKLKCSPKTGFLCAKWSCKKRDVSSYLLLDKEEKKVTRCDDTGCEDIKAHFEQAGIYYNIHSEGPIGSLIRILGDSRYKEITTIGLDAYIGNGECEVLK